MQLVVLIILVISELVFFRNGMKLFNRFCSIKWFVWVFVFSVVRINSVLNRILKWYQKFIFVIGMILWNMWVILMVSVGVLLVWFSIEGLLIFFVVCRICLGEIIKFQELMVVVVWMVIFFNCVVIIVVFLLFILCRFGMMMFRFVGGVFIVK